MGIRSKLFVVSVLLIALVGVASGTYLEERLRAWALHRIEEELRSHAGSALIWVERSAGRAPRDAQPGARTAFLEEELDPIADALAERVSARITIVSEAGAVLGDSELGPEELERIDNHRDRPEVKEALASGYGTARRYSTTTRQETMYVAIRFESAGVRGVARAAMSLAAVEDVISELRTIVVVTGLLALAIAVIISGFASHLMSRSLRSLLEWTRSRTRDLGALVHGPRSEDEITGLAGSIHDMAEELGRAVSALAKERDRFEDVLDGMTDAVLTVDYDRRITLFNRAASTLLSVAEPPLGRTLLETVRLPALLDLVERAMSGVVATSEIVLLPPSEKRVHARAAPQRSGGGCVIVLHDVTEIRRLEAVRRDFVANVSHELRTPVSIIRANAETLLEGGLDDRTRARGFVEALGRHADRLSNIIADLLDLSRIESGSYRLEVTSERLEPILRRVVDMFGEAAKKKNLSIELRVESEIRVRADGHALEQVLVNLVDNAVKYTPEGGAVTVNGRVFGAGEDAVRIEVEDSGPGIEPRHRDRIFERFYRVDPGRSREMGGTGLGLSIVRHFVEAMGGEVGVEAVAPHGSRFWLTLPIG